MTQQLRRFPAAPRCSDMAITLYSDDGTPAHSPGLPVSASRFLKLPRAYSLHTCCCHTRFRSRRRLRLALRHRGSMPHRCTPTGLCGGRCVVG